MAIPAPVPTPVTLPESLPPDHTNSSFQTEMDIDVRDESTMLEARAGDGHVLVHDHGHGHGHEPAVKKLKRVHGEMEMVLRQTAEIVMVLVGVAALRGGNQPSPLECELAAEAYEKLARIVTACAPQDLVSKDALQSLIQQLTPPPPPPARVAKPVVIVRSQSPRRPAVAAAAAATPASGPSRALSPATARSKSSSAAAAQTPAQANTPSPSPSPLPSPASTAAAASVPLPSTPNVSASPASSAQAPEPVAPAPAPATPSAPISVAPVALKGAAKTVAPTSSPAPRKAKAALAVEDVPTSGSALDGAAPSATPAAAVPATTNANIPETVSTTPSTTLKPKPGGRTSPVKQKTTPAADIPPTTTKTPSATTTTTTTTTPPTTTTVVIKDQRGNQAPKALARQRGLRNAGNNESSVVNPPDPQLTHQQLALTVHLLLKPHIITPGLPKGALSGMNAPIPCGICKAVMNTINNVLVCDGCDGGFHLHCLQVSGSQQLSVPKGDWYCVRCVTGNGGRPQAPKYGPLRRGPAGGCGPRNSWSMQAGCGSDSCKGQIPGKLVLQSRKKEGGGGGGDAVQGSVEVTCVNPRAPTDLEASKHAEKRTAAVCEQEAEPEKPAQIGAAEDDGVIVVKWVGPVVNTSQDKLFYSACSVGGETIRLQDTALFRPETPNVPPYIARLQALWEDKSSGQKWVKVNWCYYPSDLPVNMGRPVISDPREIYESNHSDNNLVGSIQGPCLVLSPLQYQEEMERRSKNSMEDPMPLFLCQSIPSIFLKGVVAEQQRMSWIMLLRKFPEIKGDGRLSSLGGP